MQQWVDGMQLEKHGYTLVLGYTRSAHLDKDTGLRFKVLNDEKEILTLSEIQSKHKRLQCVQTFLVKAKYYSDKTVVLPPGDVFSKEAKDKLRGKKGALFEYGKQLGLDVDKSMLKPVLKEKIYEYFLANKVETTVEENE